MNPHYDFYVDAGSQYGIFFSGRSGENSIYSQHWQYSPDNPVTAAAKNSYGFDIVGGDVTGSAVNGTPVSLTAKTYYIIDSSAFSLVLPAANLIAGHKLSFLISNSIDITVSCESSSIQVNNATSFVFATQQEYTRAEAIWNGSQWLFYR